MGTMRYLILAGLLVGCGSDEPEEFDCRRHELGGVYFVHWSEVDGNCSTPVDGLLALGVGVPSDECAVLSFTQDDCRFIEARDCGDYGYTMVLDQLTEDGSRVRGTMTVAGSTCRGTFRFSGTRQ